MRIKGAQPHQKSGTGGLGPAQIELTPLKSGRGVMSRQNYELGVENESP